MKRKTLWTRNFTIITLGTVVSSIGSAAMNFVLSFIVFDQTGSTFLAGLFAAISFVPRFILPVLLSSVLDRFPRMPWIIGLDVLNGIFYGLFGTYCLVRSFSFGVYAAFSLVSAAIGSVYEIAYASVYPNLVPDGFYEQGYTVSSMIYPTITMVMTPAASLLYVRFGVGWIAIVYGLLLLTAAGFETQIRLEEKRSDTVFDFRAYVADLKNGFQYLWHEKGLLAMYVSIAISQGTGTGNTNLMIAYFSMTPGLGMVRYSLFSGIEFAGRTLSGLINYRFPVARRYRFAMYIFVMMAYAVSDGVLLFLPFGLMCINRFIVGMLGITSITIRSSSVQTYIPDAMRAKLNAFVAFVYALSTMLFQVVIGALGEWIPVRLVVCAVSIGLLVVYELLLVRNRRVIEPIFLSGSKGE